MDDFSAIAEKLRLRLAELDDRSGEIESDLRGPLDTDTDEQAVDLADDEVLEGVEDVLRAEAQQVRLALARIDDGTYGTCANCGADIPHARLEAQPTATHCITCA